MALVDGAKKALLLAQAPACSVADRGPHVGRDDGRRAPLLRGALTHPIPRPRRLARQHPVQKHAVSDRAAEGAQPWPHRGHRDASPLGQKRAQLDHRPPQRVDLPGQLARPDPEPRPGGIEAEALDLRRDLARPIPMQR
jgi:hypothetical protein